MGTEVRAEFKLQVKVEQWNCQMRNWNKIIVLKHDNVLINTDRMISFLHVRFDKVNIMIASSNWLEI